MNNITIKGRLTRNPELKEYTSKKGEARAACKFTVAVDRRFGEETDFFDCCIFGKLAEVVNKFFYKGSEIVVSGEMQCNPYEAKDGTKRYPWTLMAQQFDFCGSKKDREEATAGMEDVPDGFEEADEDIPF